MAGQNVKSYLIGVNFGTRGFSGSLIRIQIQHSEIQNDIRRITFEKKIHKILKYFAIQEIYIK